jgi:hypothetical protein
MKRPDCFFKLSGRYGLFSNHVAEIPTNDQIVNVPPFPMNKTKRDAMQERSSTKISKEVSLSHQTLHGMLLPSSLKNNMGQRKHWHQKDGV